MARLGRVLLWFVHMNGCTQTVYNTKGTRAHTHRELIRTAPVLYIHAYMYYT